MKPIKRYFRSWTRKSVAFFFKPILGIFGYKRKFFHPGLPESVYFKSQDSLRHARRIHKEYLSETGWLESKNANQSIRKGEYLPWTSYAFIYWFESKKTTNQSILEFGSGASTLFWAKHFTRVDSVESDDLWFSEVGALVENLSNVSLHPLTVSKKSQNLRWNTYSAFQEVFELDKSFFPEVSNKFEDIDFVFLAEKVSKADWIFIDGGPRNFYCLFALTYARKETIFVLDNADEDYTLPARQMLMESDFIEIPFHSLGPLNPFSWTTSIFIRSIEQLK